jgi:hypothetical protein
VSDKLASGRQAVGRLYQGLKTEEISRDSGDELHGELAFKHLDDIIPPKYTAEIMRNLLDLLEKIPAWREIAREIII